MRRIVVIGTAAAMLVGAAVAYASFNKYAGSNIHLTPSAAGSNKSRSGYGMVDTFKATGRPVIALRRSPTSR
jgi:hypothetical protein